MALLAYERPQKLLLIAAIVPVALLLHDPATSDRFSLWTPTSKSKWKK